MEIIILMLASYLYTGFILACVALMLQTDWTDKDKIVIPIVLILGWPIIIFVKD